MKLINWIQNYIKKIEKIMQIFGYFSVSPINLLTKFAAETDINVQSVSVAQALANIVFPVPGGLFILNI